jgi:16S rRNA U516 pseudouridylate synthase RsuA-like enzyme|tara:strand:- start:2557 stop:2751 length:195 start_codon:yes stop_codon:yes gene_type:complete
MNKLSAFLRSRTTLHHTKGRARKVRRKFASAGGKILRLFWLTLAMTNLRPHASLLLPEFPPPLT